MATAVTQDVRVKKGSIHCEGCEATIERYLSSVPGVQIVSASREAQAVRVTWNPAEIGIDEVKAKLVELGFPVEG